MKTIVVTAASVTYLHYLEIWIKSFILAKMENVKFFVSFIIRNSDEETKIHEFLSLINHNSVVMSGDNYNIVIFDEKMHPTNTKKKTSFEIFCAHYKFHLFRNLKNIYNIIVWIDCDAIIRKSLVGLIDLSKTYDLLLKFRPQSNSDEGKLLHVSHKKTHTGKILAGVIVVNTKNKMLVDDIYDKYCKLQWCWYNDQLVFNEIIKCNSYLIGDIPIEYFSCHCDPTHYIWLCKGHTFTHNRPIWKEEKEKILSVYIQN